MAMNAAKARTQQSMGFEVQLLLIFTFAGLAYYFYTNKHPTQAEYDEVQRKYTTLLQKTGYTDDQVKKKLTKPPLISLSEAKGFSFPSGQATIAPEFEEQLERVIIPQIVAAAKEHHLDLVEVVGHTDEVPITSHAASTLDRKLVTFMAGGNVLADSLIAVDNTGLAMTRAVAVARILRVDDQIKAAGLVIVNFSAGQLIDIDGRPTNGGGWTDPSRRRIDIRLRRLNEATEQVEKPAPPPAPAPAAKPKPVPPAPKPKPSFWQRFGMWSW